MKLASSIVFLFAASFFLASDANAQLPQTHSLSTSMAHAIGQANQESVIVFDFWGPDKKLNGLGQYVAQNFSSELSNPPPPFSVLDRSKIVDSCAKYHFSTQTLGDRAASVWLANDTGASVAILGKLAILGDQLTVEVSSYKTKNGKFLAGFKASLPLTNDMRALMDRVVPDIPPEETAKASPAGKNGYGFPKCAYCPPAPYVQRAQAKNIQGTVTLIAIVGADGKAHDLFVTKALPDGLTESAIETVQSWKFHPALGPDGKPADVWQTIEVTFHLY